MNYITPVELKQELGSEGITLVDIREAYELEICEIGGLHIPMAEVSERYNEIDASTKVAILCRSGRRAEAVANFLEAEAGMNDVVIVEGGILRWIEEIDNSLEAY